VLAELKAHIIKHINLFNYAGESEMASGWETTSNGSSCFDTKEDDQKDKEEFNYWMLLKRYQSLLHLPIGNRAE